MAPSTPNDHPPPFSQRGSPPSLHRAAFFDATGQYRYWLSREWSLERPAIAFFMLNPSRADAHQDDPTLRRCIRLAQSWGYGSLVVVNLFAYCTPSPQVLQTVADPIGPETDRILRETAQTIPTLLLAWGNGGCWQDRDRAVLSLLAPWRDRLFHLGKTQQGHPRHPLYLPRHLRPIPWTDP